MQIFISNVEEERQLFKAAVASSAARVCVQKQLGVVIDDRKVTVWWNREVNFYPSKESGLPGLDWEQSWIFFTYVVRWGRRYAPQVIRKSKMQFWANIGHRLDSSYWQAINVFWQIIVLATKDHMLLDSSKAKTVFKLSKEGDILRRWREYFKSFEPSSFHTIRHIRGALGGGKIITATEVFLTVKTQSWEGCKLWWNPTRNAWSGGGEAAAHGPNAARVNVGHVPHQNFVGQVSESTKSCLSETSS